MKKFKNILATFLFLFGISFALVNAQYDSMGIYIGNGSETYIPYNPYTGSGSGANPYNNYNNQVCPAIFPSPYSCGSANYYCPAYGGYVTRSQCPNTNPTGACISPAVPINYFADPGPNAPRCACPDGSQIGYNTRCPDNNNETTCIKYADDLIHTKECRSECPNYNTYYKSNSICYYYNCPIGTKRRTSDQYCITIQNQTCPPNSIPYAIPSLGDCVCANIYGAYVGVLVNYGGTCPTNTYPDMGTPKYCLDGTVVYGDATCRDVRDNDPCQGISWRWMWWRKCPAY
jgi:hypothetical protein